MAAPMQKRGLEGSEEICDSPAKRGRFSGDSQKVSNFLDWCNKGRLLISPKAQVTDKTCAQYGMIATANIAAGECIFEIPRTLLLTPENCNIAELLRKESSYLQSSSGWVPLLVALLHEYTNPTSPWRAYLNLCPDFSQLDPPMFWPKAEMEKELLNTGVVESVKRDEENISKEFTSLVLPFVQRHPQYFSKSCEDIELYKKMVAFVMAYSFTEPDTSEEEDEDSGDTEQRSPYMVPMADILNHVAKNNAHLDFGAQSLKIVAVRDIAQGEEIYNTYGELSNMHLLHMYGFTEPFPNNHYDTVDILHTTIHTCLQASGQYSQLEEKWQHLQKIGVVGAGGACVVGVGGVLTEVETSLMLKVLHMDSIELRAAMQADGWESDDDDNDGEESLEYADFRKISPAWKNTLAVICQHAIAKYPNSLAEEEAVLHSASWQQLTARQQFALQLRHGQLKLLQQLLDNCTGAACIQTS